MRRGESSLFQHPQSSLWITCPRSGKKVDEAFGNLYNRLVPNENQVENSVDSEDSQSMSWDSSPTSGKHIMDPITPNPCATKAKRDFSGVKEIIPPLTSMKWVYPTMKEDLERAFQESDKHFYNSCNFWFRYIMWKKRDLTKIDKDHFSQAAFGVLPSQLT